jgi:O-antigen/teichoic acid export membrane protein
LTRKQEPGGALSVTVLRGTIWLFVSFALSKLVRLAMMLAVAVFLSPQAYGIITLSLIIIVVVQIIGEFGIWQAIVQRPNPDERYINTAFTANIPIGFVAAAGVFFAAPWIADALEEPEVSLMLRVMGLALLVEGFRYVPDGLLRKELRFKERTLPEAAGAFAAATVTIALLLTGVGVVSFAVGFVAECVVRCGLIIWTAVNKIKWRPKLEVSRAHLKELFSYAKHILGTELVKYVSSNIDFFIVGRVLGAGPLGFYALAFNLANYPVTNLALILSKIAFPAFAALQEDIDYARRVYLKTIRLLAAVAVPVLTMMALLATTLIVQLLGEEWQPAVLPLQAMVLAGISRTVSVPSSDMLRAVGFPDVPFKISVVEGCALLGALLLVVHRGIAAVALTAAVILSLASWATVGAACRVLGVGVRELISSLVPSTALAASGAAAVLSLQLLDLSFLPGVVELVLLFTAAGGAMAICLVTVCRGLFREIVALAPLSRLR